MVAPALNPLPTGRICRGMQLRTRQLLLASQVERLLLLLVLDFGGGLGMTTAKLWRRWRLRGVDGDLVVSTAIC